MGKRTMRFVFESEFTGELPADVSKPEEWAKEFQANPERYVQHDEDMERFKASIELDGRKFSLNLVFTIVLTDDEKYLSDGSYTNDKVDRWEDELPIEGLTITVAGKTFSPGKVKCLDVE
jgi:hypothetical protein